MTAGTPGRSFDETAATYAAVRPTYPGPALDWLLPRAAHRVLDLAAGTGKLTGLLVARGLEVVAVEPSSPMRAELAAAVPEAELLAGTAEAIPLPAAAVDAVLVASAFHWFDPDPAMTEIRRVLRPGGRLGLLGNHPDERIPWVAALARITGAAARRRGRRRAPDAPAGFERVAQASFTHSLPVSRAELLALTRTYSYYLTLEAPARQHLLSRIGALVDTHPDLAGQLTFALPFVTACWRAGRT